MMCGNPAAVAAPQSRTHDEAAIFNAEMSLALFGCSSQHFTSGKVLHLELETKQKTFSVKRSTNGLMPWLYRLKNYSIN